MTSREATTLNIPAKKWFERKLKCAFSRTEFRFLSGKLDVLAYNRNRKCFHVAEGKFANRVSSVGHAVGQLVAYISMLQENGYDFLDRISKEAKLHLSDFTSFLENKSIKVCFYVILPSEQKEKILGPAQLMLKNIGDFGDSIGILISSKNKCYLEKQAAPINIKIRKTYQREEFLQAVKDKFLATKIAGRLEEKPDPWTNTIQFVERKIGERKGNPFLHFEVWARRKLKNEKAWPFEIGFHLEWAKNWLKDSNTKKRANKIRKEMLRARTILRKDGLNFHYEGKWGKAWSRLFTIYKTNTNVIDDETLEGVLSNLVHLSRTLLPRLNKINWGRKKKQKEEIM